MYLLTINWAHLYARGLAVFWNKEVICNNILFLLFVGCSLTSFGTTLSEDAFSKKYYQSAFLSAAWGEPKAIFDEVYLTLSKGDFCRDFQEYYKLIFDLDSTHSISGQTFIPHFQILAGSIRSLSDQSHLQNDLVTSARLARLMRSITADCQVLAKMGMDPAELQAYVLDYRLVQHRLVYYQIKWDFYQGLFQAGVIGQYQMRGLSETILGSLWVINQSGLMNAQRKNEGVFRFNLIEKVLDFLVIQNPSPDIQSLIERAFIMSKTGELGVNRQVLKTSGTSSFLLAELMEEIEPLEAYLYQGGCPSGITLVHELLRKNLLRNKYLKIIRDFRNDRPDQIPVEAFKTPGVSLLTCFEGRSWVYQYVVSGNRYQLLKHDKQLLTGRVQEMMNLISNGPDHLKGGVMMSERIKEMSHDLYEILFGKLSIAIHEELRIDSDGVLNMLPFEVLIDSNGMYLLDRYRIGYGSIIVKDYKREIVPRVGYYANDFKNSELAISGTLKETAYRDEAGWYGVSQLNGRNSLLKDSSTVLHIATHQVFSEKGEPTLLVPDSLFREHLYNTTRSAELVILSACATMYGQIVSGEGTRSFGMRSWEVGASSVISSLWPVEDFTTSEIVNKYLTQLLDGEGSGASLQLAKRDFLTESDRFYQHPFFWAAFKHYGGEVVLKGTSYGVYSWLLLFLLPLFFCKLKIRLTY